MKALKLLLIVVVLLLFPIAAHAEWERTMSAWDTRLPDEGKLQLTFWGGYWETGYTSSELKEITGYLDITYGISDKWSIALSPSIYLWNEEPGPSESGVSDTSIMTTYRFIDEADMGFDMAVQGRLYLPTGDEEKWLGSGSYEPGIKMLLSKDFGSFIGVFNLGGDMILNSRIGEKDVVGRISLEGIYPLNEELSLNMALSGSTKRYDGGDNGADIGAGFRYTPKNSTTFLGGMVYTSFTDQYDWGVQLAIGFEL